MAGLFDVLRQYISDASPGGSLNPEVRPGEPTALAKAVLGFVPGIGDAISGYDAVQSAKEGDWLGAGLNGIGLLPFVPSLAGMVNPLKKSAREAYKANRELFDNAHRAQDLTFTAIPLSQITDATSIYKSPRYGKQSSEYYVGIVNGEPAYIRRADHWGNFTTNVKEGTPEAERLFPGVEGDQFGRVGLMPHNWQLEGGKASKSADRIAEIKAIRDSMTSDERLFGDEGQRLWDELYKLEHQGSEAGYIPISKLKKQPPHIE